MTAKQYTRNPQTVVAWRVDSADDATAAAVVEWVEQSGGQARFEPAHPLNTEDASMGVVAPAVVLNTHGGAKRAEAGTVIVRDAVGHWTVETQADFDATHVVGVVRDQPSATVTRAALLGLLAADSESEAARLANLEAGVEAIAGSLA